MPVSLTFLGATRTVTGSRYLLETSGANLLIDCGMYQERRNLGLNWENHGLEPARVDAVLLTHGHMDHCGWLPKLVKDGFRGPVFCTPATADLVPIILRDIARIQEEDARNKAKRHAREGRRGRYPEVPLYDGDDAEKAVSLLKPIPFQGKKIDVARGVSAEWGENGHILGAAWIGVEAEGRRIVFSGDIGRWNRPILHNPAPPTKADYLIIESTYGNRVHPVVDTAEELAGILDAAAKRGGNLLIPSFSVERAQELLYDLSLLGGQGRLPFSSVCLDSPMASKVTDLFRRHPEECDAEMAALMQAGKSPFAFAELRYIASAAESKKLNGVRSGLVVIAGNGMCTGGRIKHHLLHNLARPETTVLFAGFQAPGTLGRQLMDGASEIRLFNSEIRVAADIRQLTGLSGHADRAELLRWSGRLAEPPRHCFVTHGDADASFAFAETLSNEYGWKTGVPAFGDKALLD